MLRTTKLKMVEVRAYGTNIGMALMIIKLLIRIDLYFTVYYLPQLNSHTFTRTIEKMPYSIVVTLTTCDPPAVFYGLYSSSFKMW